MKQQFKLWLCVFMLSVIFVHVTPSLYADGKDPVFALISTQPGSADDTIITELITRIENSTTSIDLCMYDLDLNDVVNALILAHAAGKTVRVIGEEDNVFYEETQDVYHYTQPFQDLVDGGVQVHSNAGTGMYFSMHHKFVVFDNQVVWTGSWNATSSGTFNNSNDVLIIDPGTESEIASQYTSEFNQMWAGSYSTTKTYDGFQHSFDFGSGVEVKTYFSPGTGIHSPKAQILSEIYNAESSIHFLMFSYTDSDISRAMVSKYKENPQIEILAVFDEFSNGDLDESQMKEFLRLGIPVKLDTFSAFFIINVLL